MTAFAMPWGLQIPKLNPAALQMQLNIGGALQMQLNMGW